MRVVFMGTPDFARESLQALDQSGYEIVGVVTNPDKPSGRGMKLQFSPVKEYAQEKKFVIYQPEKVRNNIEFIEQIKALKPDFICVVAYGKILPQELLDIPKYGSINVHGSLLPKYRGAAPIQWAVLNGDKETGITTMFMNAGMDTGDMLLKKKVEIGTEETTGELWERLSKIGAELLVETLKKIEDGTIVRQKQPEEYTLAPMLKKEMAQIDWQIQTAEQIKNLTRGLNPIMGAYSYLDGKKIKLWRVKFVSDEELLYLFPELKEYEYKLRKMEPGTILFSDSRSGLYIKAKEGNISILEIQGENAKKMTISEFLRGNNIQVGSILGESL